MGEAHSRPAWVEVDLDAIRSNAAALLAVAAPAQLCAVVKANGYGHGAVPVARAALAGGATWLAVAVVEEGVALRDAGIDAPVLLLSEPPEGAMATVVAQSLTPTLYTSGAVAAAADAASGASLILDVHVKVDTGMHRVGAEPSALLTLCQMVEAAPSLRLAGVWTHLAVADEQDDGGYTRAQLGRLDHSVASLRGAGIDPGLVHAANSAGTLAAPGGPYGMVRCGIALYGYAPAPHLAAVAALRPALRLAAQVTFVKEVAAGERLSYGLRYELGARSTVATVPLGYADGVPRRLSAVGGEVVVGGRRRPIAGTVTMDQLLVDCGPDAPVVVGDEVVLLGRQGDEEVTAEEWAMALDTISYEVLCGIGPRVPRRYTGAGAGAGAGADAGRPGGRAG